MVVIDIPTIWTTKFLSLEDVLPGIPQVYIQLLSWHTHIVASYPSQIQHLYPKHTSSQIHYANNLFCKIDDNYIFQKLQSQAWCFLVQLGWLILENFFFNQRDWPVVFYFCDFFVWLCYECYADLGKGNLPVPHFSGFAGIWEGLILF
jgi:hypothetical protein